MTQAIKIKKLDSRLLKMCKIYYCASQENGLMKLKFVRTKKNITI